MSLDTKVKNLIINTNMTKEQYEAIDDKSNQLFFVEDSSVVDVPAPEENKSGYLHTDGTNLTWEEIESGDYLPLSGGTLTGTLSSSVPIGTKSLDLPAFTVEKRTNTSVVMQIGMTNIVADVGCIRPYLNNNVTLGDSTYGWSNIFTAKINNGADLAIPTEGGTLARVEDIDEAVGDISTALTAILGE